MLMYLNLNSSQNIQTLLYMLCFILKLCEQRNYLLNNCISKEKRLLKQKVTFQFCRNHAHQSPRGRVT